MLTSPLDDEARENDESRDTGRQEPEGRSGQP